MHQLKAADRLQVFRHGFVDVLLAWVVTSRKHSTSSFRKASKRSRMTPIFLCAFSPLALQTADFLTYCRPKVRIDRLTSHSLKMKLHFRHFAVEASRGSYDDLRLGSTRC